MRRARAWSWWSALLGILKAGGAYVPLDPAYPRRAPRPRCWATPAPSVLVSQEALLRPAPRASGARSSSSTGRRDRGRAGNTPAVRRRSAERWPTSSTPRARRARPKGVVVEHARRWRTSPARCGRATASSRATWCWRWRRFAFDVSVFEVLVRAGQRRDGPSARPSSRSSDPVAVLEELRTATVLHAVPALMRQLVSAAGGALPGAAARLVGGEAVPPELVAEMGEVCPRRSCGSSTGPPRRRCSPPVTRSRAG